MGEVEPVTETSPETKQQVFGNPAGYKIPLGEIRWAPTRMPNILHRKQILVNTDPQRRCYNGCNFSEELQWTGWSVLEVGIPQERIEQRLTFWRELNDYAVSQRGEGAKSEFKTEE